MWYLFELIEQDSMITLKEMHQMVEDKYSIDTSISAIEC